MSSEHTFIRFTVATSFALAVFGMGGCVAQSQTDDPEQVGARSDAWDSQAGNPTHATHSYLTEYAIDSLKAQYPELQSFRSVIVDGANQELHELPVSDPFMEELRIAAAGTNWAANHPEVVWNRALASYAAKDKAQAYWYTGVVLHWVEDMGVPAHAFHVIHQGTLTQKDNFELLGLQRWAPLFDAPKADPAYHAPSDYVLWSGDWSRGDFTTTFPGVTYKTNYFSSSWIWVSSKQGTFVREREGRTALTTKYALGAAAKAFAAIK